MKWNENENDRPIGIGPNVHLSDFDSCQHWALSHVSLHKVDTISDEFSLDACSHC